MIFKYDASSFTGKSIIDFLNHFGLGKSKIYTLFLDKLIKVNDIDINRNYILMDSDIVSITENEEIDFLPDNKKLDIIFEDDYLLIVNKPSGLIVHPDDKSKNGTLCNIVSNYYFKKGYDLSVKYAHRIDIDTSGIIIFSKDMLTQAYMNNIISTHTLERYYICLASGSFKDKKGTINLPIGEDRHHKSRRRVSKTGQNAITHYEVIKEYNGFSKLLVKLQTGRTHQIRVHMSHIGHPLLGDELYGGSLKKIKRVALHSYLVRFNHPVTGEKIELKKELPYDLKKILGVD
jgi:23S rRNA pseudouridine1911/1915/1917 synthase